MSTRAIASNSPQTLAGVSLCKQCARMREEKATEKKAKLIRNLAQVSLPHATHIYCVYCIYSSTFSVPPFFLLWMLVQCWSSSNIIIIMQQHNSYVAEYYHHRPAPLGPNYIRQKALYCDGKASGFSLSTTTYMSQKSLF